MMKELYVISGMTGMTGNELARQIIARGEDVIGFDNFFASSRHTIADIESSPSLDFFEISMMRLQWKCWRRRCLRQRKTMTG